MCSTLPMTYSIQMLFISVPVALRAHELCNDISLRLKQILMVNAIGVSMSIAIMLQAR